MDTGSVQHPDRDVRQGGSEYKSLEYNRNCLPPVPGGGNTSGGSLQATDDGRVAFVSGETECPGTVQGVQGGDGDRVSGIPSTDASGESNIQENTLGNQGPWQRAMHLQYGFTNRWGTKELPHQGVSGMGGNMDGDAGSFLVPTCPGHCHYIGGGKSPPPIVPPMRYSGDLASTEWAALRLLLVRQRGREEPPTDGGRGDA